MPTTGREHAQPHATAVVLCDGPAGLGVVRALHLHGVQTIAIVLDAWAPVLASRFPKRKVVLPAAPRDTFHTRLCSLLQGLGEERPVLIPTSDQFASIMLEHRDELATGFDFCLPDGRLLDLLNDKAEETRLVASLGIPVPRTVQVLPARWQELEASLGLPMIIKPRSFEHKGCLGRKNLVLRKPAEGDELYERHRDHLGVLIAQEVVPGLDDTLWLCSATFNHRHQLVEGLVKKKIRMSPPHFGVCSFAVSASNPEILDLAARLGSGLRYTGHAALEFKWDRRDGLYKYIELNPRTPASVTLDQASGVPTVWNTYRVARGEDVAPVAPRQRDGVVYLSLLEDVYSRLKDGETPAAILRHYLGWAFHKRVGPQFAWDDPLPGVVHTWRYLSNLVAGRLRRLGIGGSRRSAAAAAACRLACSSRAEERGRDRVAAERCGGTAAVPR